MNKQLEKQNFHEVEVTSGFIMKLIKQTQENIRLGKQQTERTNNEKENNKKKQPNILKGLRIEVLADSKKDKQEFQKGLSQFLLKKYQQGYFN